MTIQEKARKRRVHKRSKMMMWRVAQCGQLAAVLLDNVPADSVDRYAAGRILHNLALIENDIQSLINNNKII